MQTVQCYALSDKPGYKPGDNLLVKDKETILYNDPKKALRAAGWVIKIARDNNKKENKYSEIYLVEGHPDIFKGIKEVNEYLFTDFPTQLKVVEHVRSFTEKEAFNAIKEKQFSRVSKESLEQKNWLNQIITFFSKRSR